MRSLTRRRGSAGSQATRWSPALLPCTSTALPRCFCRAPLEGGAARAIAPLHPPDVSVVVSGRQQFSDGAFNEPGAAAIRQPFALDDRTDERLLEARDSRAGRMERATSQTCRNR